MADNAMPDEMTMWMKRTSVLKMQCKKHQIFKERLPEALKMSEAGNLHLRIADSLSEPEERAFHFKEAATCLARAKRLSREMSRGLAR